MKRSLILSAVLMLLFTSCDYLIDSLSHDFSDGSATSVPTDGLVGEWLFDGDADDTSENGLNATTYGVTLTSDRNGVSSGAYSFDGSNDYIRISDNDLLDTDDAMSISVWVYPESTGTSQWVISKFYSNAIYGDYFLSFADSMEWSWQYYNYGAYSVDAEAIDVSSVYALEENSWNHLVVTYDSGVSKAYLDGTQVGSYSGVILELEPDEYSYDDIYIGKFWNNQYYFKGKMDDIRIYNRALTALEVTALYNDDGQTPAE